MNQKTPSKSFNNRFKPSPIPTRIRTPIYGQIWNTRQNITSSKSFPGLKKSFPNSINNNKRNNQQQQLSIRNNNAEQRLDFALFQLDTSGRNSESLDDLPTSIYRYNNREFLHSLRNFHEPSQIRFRTTSLARYMKMSREIVDDFVRLKSNDFEQNVIPPVNPIVEKIDQISPSIQKTFKKNVSNGNKKRIIRPKSAIACRRKALNNNMLKSKSNKPESFSDEEVTNDDKDEMEEELKPMFHRSLDKISSIANWERQIRYELEIEKELQKRESERQREKLQNDQRKLEDWDKQLRIELDARERKLRLGEDELKSRQEEFHKKSNELMRREQMINEIVSERIKAEMKLEIEKLRKKFNELEVDKSNLLKKEERVKEVEARLHEQVKIVKEKIDSKRMSDIELAKYRKELEITKKENEVLKEKVNSMEDYQITKFENRALKNELQILKETLDNKNQELERDRERFEREQRSSDQKIMSLKRELRKAEQELDLLKQKSQADIEEINSKYEASNGQVKRLQLFIKDHLAKLNNDFSITTQTLKHIRQSSYSGSKLNHQINHHRGHSFNHTPNAHHHNRLYNHQRSVSMDGFNRNFRSSNVRGCRLCDDDENEDDYNNNKFRNEIMRDCIRDDDEDELERPISVSPSVDDNNLPPIKHESTLNKSNEYLEQEHRVDSSDEFVKKIVDKIYEKMSHKVPETLTSPIENNIPSPIENGDDSFAKNSFKLNFLNSDNSNSKNNPNDQKSLTHHFETSLNLDQTPVHRTLYEELMIASEMEKSKNLTSSPIKQNNAENIKTLPDMQQQQQQQQTSSTKFDHLQSSFSINKLHNDTNNNRINADRPKNDIISTSAPMVATSNHHSGDSNYNSSKSESFEIDW